MFFSTFFFIENVFFLKSEKKNSEIFQNLKNFNEKSTKSLKKIDFSLTFFRFWKFWRQFPNIFNFFKFKFSKLFFSMKKKVEKKSKYSSPAKSSQESISDVFRTIWALLPRFWIELILFSGFFHRRYPPKEILWHVGWGWEGARYYQSRFRQ